MKDWKTTISGIVGALAALLGAFNIVIPQEVAAGIVAIAVFAVGFFAKDSTPAPTK